LRALKALQIPDSKKAALPESRQNYKLRGNKVIISPAGGKAAAQKKRGKKDNFD